MIRISSIEKLIGAFIAFISCMLIVRMLYSGSNMYLFLLWNIFPSPMEYFPGTIARPYLQVLCFSGEFILEP